jgi:hypothetical protein
VLSSRLFHADIADADMITIVHPFTA